jgi:hypothetical protein
MTTEEQEIVAQAGIPPALVEEIRAELKGAPLRRMGQDDDAPAAGILLEGIAERVEETVTALRRRFKQRGYLLFHAERGHGFRPDAVGLLRGEDPLQIVVARGTCDPNGGVTNEEMLARLRAWQTRFRFDIYGADYDWVELEFLTLPDDLPAFAEEIEAFCPDIIDQGFCFPAEQELMEAEQVEDNSTMLLAMLRDLQVVGASREGSLERLAEVATWHASVPATLQREEAIHKRALELLAASIQKDRRLFLWWD